MQVKFRKTWIVTVRDYFGTAIDRFEMTGYTREQVREQVKTRLNDYGIGYKATIAPNNELNKKKLREHLSNIDKIKERRKKNSSINIYLRRHKINVNNLNELLHLLKNAGITLDDLISFCESHSS